jgi:flagellar motor protein MotB
VRVAQADRRLCDAPTCRCGRELLAEIEEKQFAATEAALRQTIQDVPELKQLADSLIIERPPEGMRIQIVDPEKYAMFPKGNAEMNDIARRLMEQVAKVVAKMPQKISITGHTDATPYINPQGYDNWDFSTDRTNARRRTAHDWVAGTVVVNRRPAAARHATEPCRLRVPCHASPLMPSPPSTGPGRCRAPTSRDGLRAVSSRA